MVDASPVQQVSSACLAFYLPDLSHATQPLSLLPRGQDTIIQVLDGRFTALAEGLAQTLKSDYHRDPILCPSPALDYANSGQGLGFPETAEILVQICSGPRTDIIHGKAGQAMCQFAAAQNQLGILLIVGEEPCSPEVEASNSLGVVALSTHTPVQLIEETSRAIIDLLIYSRLLARSQRWLNQYKPPYLLLNQRDLEAVQLWQQSLTKSVCQQLVQLTDLQTEFLRISHQALLHREARHRKPHPPEVFISYSRRDTQAVKKMHRYLAHQGVQLWVDWENIPIASDWWAEIEEAIQTVHTVIFAVSSSSIKSKYCAQEVDLAQRLQKRIVPVILESDIEEREIHPYARQHQHLSFAGYNSIEEGAARLYTVLQTDLEHVKFHTKLYNQAAEWVKDNYSKDLLLRGRFLAKAQKWLSLSSVENKEPSPTRLHEQYVRASERQHKSVQTAIFVLCSSVLLSVFSISAVNMMRSEIKNLLSSIGNRDQGLMALIEAIYTGSDVHYKSWLFPISGPSLRSQATSALQREINDLREMNRLEGHSGVVYKALFTPDSSRLISAGEDANIGIWPLEGIENFSNHRLFKQHNQDVVAIDVNSGGKLIASGGYDGQVMLWNTETRELVKSLKGPSEARILTLTFNQTGNFLAAGSDDGKVYLWRQADDFDQPKILSHAGKVVTSMSFSPDARQLATADSDGKIRLWSLDGNLEDELDHGALILSILHSQDGQTLISAGLSSKLKVWNLATKTATELGDSQSTIHQIAISPDGLLLAAAGQDNTVRVWRKASGGKTFGSPTTLTAHTTPVYRVAFSPDQRFLATAGVDGQLNLWSIEASTEQIKLLDSLRGHTNDVLGLDFNHTSTQLASSSRDGSIRIWNLQQPYPNLPHDTDVLDVVFDPQSEEVITTGIRSVTRWDQETYKPKGLMSIEGKAMTSDLSPSGQYLATGNNLGKIWIFPRDENGISAEPLKVDIEPELRDSSIDLIRFRPGVQSLGSEAAEVFAVVVDESREVYLKTTLGESINAITHDNPVKKLAWSTDGAFLVTSAQTQDSTEQSTSEIQVWQVQSSTHGSLAITPMGEPWTVDMPVVDLEFLPASDKNELLIVKETGELEIRSLEGSSKKSLLLGSTVSDAKTLAADVNAEGNLLATLNDKGFVTLWNLSDNRQLYTSQIHKGRGLNIRFNPANSYQFATTGIDDKAVIVNLSPNVDDRALELALGEGCKLAYGYLWSLHRENVGTQYVRRDKIRKTLQFCKSLTEEKEDVEKD